MAQIQKKDKKPQTQDDKKKKKILIGCLCGVGAAALIAGITIPLVMCTNSKILVTFASNDANVTITPSTVKVEKGTTFDLVRSQVLASKVVGNKQYVLTYWYQDIEGTESEVGDDFVINESLTVYPHFEEVAEDEIIINFTPAPGDEGKVTISTQSKTIKEETTFVQVLDDVTATKIVDGKEWDLQWWYKDGDEPERRMSNDIMISENITVHPYFTPPVVPKKVTLNFVEGTQEAGDVTISSKGGTHFTVDQYTTFGSILEENEISATRSDGASFQYWAVDPFVPVEDKPWVTPTRVDESTRLENDILNVYPYFIAPEPEWTDKTIAWERIPQDEEGTSFVDYSKDAVVNVAPQVNTYNFTLSHFLLKDPNDEKPELNEEPMVLDVDDHVDVEFDFSASPTPYTVIFTKAEIINEGTQSLNKLNVRIEVNIEGIDLTQITDPIPFGLKFSLTNERFQKSFEVIISGFSLNIINPEPEVLPAKVSYHAPASTNAEVTETFETEKGIKSVTIDSAKRAKSGDSTKGFFTLSRALRSEENLEAIIEGDNADNLQVSNIHVVNEGTDYYVNFDIGFKKINGLGSDHIADFKLKFIVKADSSLGSSESPIPDTFVIKFIHDDTFWPYAIAIDAEYTAALGSTEINFVIDIENIKPEGSEKTYFKKGDFLTIRNLTRESNPTNPVWFTSPQEQGNPTYPSGSEGAPIIPLEGQNAREASIRMNFFYHGEELPEPDERTAYPVELQFDFWNGDSLEEGTRINTVTKNVTFVFDPDIPLVYSNDIWAQTHSLAIYQEGIRHDGTVDKSLGTGWIISKKWNQSGNIFYNVVTAYDVKKEYEEFENTEVYSDHKFAIALYNSAKYYLPGDDNKYILIDGGSEFASIDPYDNNDLFEFRINDDYIKWQDNLYWDRLLADDIGPNMAVLQLSLSGIYMSMPNEILYNRYMYKFEHTLGQWAANDLPEADVMDGQLTGVYNPTGNKDFDRSAYAYGYVGGFDCKEITLPDGTKTNAFYWKSFDKPLTWGELDLYGTISYYFVCEGDGEPLGQKSGGGTIYHRCPAFTLTLDYFERSEYFGPAGRGAMFLLRPRDPQYVATLLPPIVAGINWNGAKWFNNQGHISPFFDCFTYDSNWVSGRNLLEPYLKPMED